MAIDTKEQRDARERAEAAAREANVRRYEEKMGVQLPYSPVSVIERPVVNVNPSKTVNVNEKTTPKVNVNRKAYMLDYMKKYRAREKKCRHCGKVL